MAQQDQESIVRSLAVSSLGFIDHELVFPAVLIGMADESRDVRAAAARALSRLSFDRTAAYGTLVRVADDQTLRDVAQACIKAGIVSQNIDRLASRDRRQAYEAFCLISLLAKAGVTAPILEAIENHQNMGVRLSVIHLLASTGDDSVFEQLQQIAGNDELAEEIKIAALNEMYTIQQAGRREHERHNEAQLSRVNVSEEIAFGQTETDASEVSM
jgi:HEAT repeat protein